MEEGISRVRQGFFAFYMELGPAYKIIQDTYEEDEKCGFHEINFLLYTHPYMAVPYKSPYLEIFRVK